MVQEIEACSGTPAAVQIYEEFVLLMRAGKPIENLLIFIMAHPSFHYCASHSAFSNNKRISSLSYPVKGNLLWRPREKALPASSRDPGLDLARERRLEMKETYLLVQ